MISANLPASGQRSLPAPSKRYRGKIDVAALTGPIDAATGIPGNVRPNDPVKYWERIAFTPEGSDIVKETGHGKLGAMRTVQLKKYGAIRCYRVILKRIEGRSNAPVVYVPIGSLAWEDPDQPQLDGFA